MVVVRHSFAPKIREPEIGLANGWPVADTRCMAIVSASGVVSTGMLWLGKQNIPSVIHKTWTPPVSAASTTTNAFATALGTGTTAVNGAGNALIQGSRDAATQSFLFGLKIAQTDSDREASAKQYLAATQNLSASDRASDTSLQALTVLAQSIVTRTKNQPPSAFLSTYR